MCALALSVAAPLVAPRLPPGFEGNMHPVHHIAEPLESCPCHAEQDDRDYGQNDHVRIPVQVGHLYHLLSVIAAPRCGAVKDVSWVPGHQVPGLAAASNGARAGSSRAKFSRRCRAAACSRPTSRCLTSRATRCSVSRRSGGRRWRSRLAARWRGSHRTTERALSGPLSGKQPHPVQSVGAVSKGTLDQGAECGRRSRDGLLHPLVLPAFVTPRRAPGPRAKASRNPEIGAEGATGDAPTGQRCVRARSRLDAEQEADAESFEVLHPRRVSGEAPNA